MIGKDPLESDQLTLPKSMSNAPTVATLKDTPSDALTAGLTNSVPTIPASEVTRTAPQNVVPSQHSFVGSILGDKYALTWGFLSVTKPLTRATLERLV